MKTEMSTLDRIRTRPRFRMNTQLSAEEYTANLEKFCAARKDRFSANINREMATIKVKNDSETYWKPNLTLRAANEEGKTVVRGVFGPSSAVWTFFMFLFFMWGILWMVFITLWFVGRQIKSKDYEWALPVSFIMLALLLLTHLAGLYGQKKAKKEMEMLRNFAVDSTLPHEEKD